MPVACICLTCGKSFLRRRSSVGQRTFCSFECSRKIPIPQHRPRPPLVFTEEGTALVPLCARDGSVKAYAIIDSADADLISQWRWGIADGYAKRYASRLSDQRGRGIFLHRELLGLVHGDGLEGDHINRNTLDNRRSNLRIVPKGAQPQNRTVRSGTTSKYRGVTWDRSKKRWCAQVGYQGRHIFVGRFDSEEEAAEAARAARARILPYAVD